MLSLLLMDGEAEYAPRLRSVLHYNGLPLDARSVTDGILNQEREGTTPAVDGQARPQMS
jgi:2-oxoglutarate ferredoxin oxidoreductase subunit alpha